MALEGSELLEPSFAEFGEQVVLFCHITSHVEGDKYPALLTKKGGSGWPHIVVMDPDGNLLAPLPRGPRTTSAFEQTVEAAGGVRRELEVLADRAATGKPTAAIALFEKQLELSHLDVATASATLAKLEGLDDDKRDALDKLIMKAEIGEIMAGATRDPADQVACGKQFAAMVAADRIPDDADALSFWYFSATYAKDAKDEKLLGKAIEGLRRQKRIPERVIDELAEALEEMKNEKQ